MATILVTGASGQLGSELKKVSKNYFGYEFIFTDIGDVDITDEKQTKSFIDEHRPDWIINCAAYNSVDKAESEPEKAMAVNSTAVANISASILGSECRFIHISSDYVFDGAANIPYNESSPVNPLSAYGRSKLAGEKNALRHHGSMVIRTSWLYSEYGSNFVKTILKNAREKGELRVVFDQTGTPTYAFGLASAIMKIVAGVIRNQIAFNAGIYHYSDEGVCSWYDFAVMAVAEAGIKCKITPVLSSEFSSAASRPAYSVMNKAKIRENYNVEIQHWVQGLKSCISNLKQTL